MAIDEPSGAESGTDPDARWERGAERATGAEPERDPADVHGLDLESLWRLCEPEPVNPPPDPLLGRDFDGLRLERVVGEGGMGRVYEARRLDGSSSAAVKVLRPGLWSRELVRRFAKESKILGRLDHPGISRVLSVGTCDVVGTAVPYMVMEFVAGARPITTFVRDADLDAAAATALFTKVCDAVAHGHALGIVHRDLKPANILVDPTGAPKVIDFGVARGMSGGLPDSTLTLPGGIVGTLMYMSPEQVRGDDGAIDARADVHALGAILHELLEGRPPFPIDGLTVVEAARQIEEVPAPRAERAPPGVADIIVRCLAKDPSERPADAGAVAAALREALATGKSPWKTPAVHRAAGRPRQAVHGAILGLLAGSALLLAVQGVRHWDYYEGLAAACRDGAATLVARLAGGERLIFDQAFRSIEQVDADAWLVESRGMKKWEEDSTKPRVNYWGPAEAGIEGTLVYRFSFPAPAARIFLIAQVNCWDFTVTRGLGRGRGVATVEMSRDGKDWLVLHDGIATGAWGEWWGSAGDLPAEVTGGRELWMRIRLLAEGTAEDYTVAQFARSTIGSPDDVFILRAFERGWPPKTGH